MTSAGVCWQQIYVFVIGGQYLTFSKRSIGKKLIVLGKEYWNNLRRKGDKSSSWNILYYQENRFLGESEHWPDRWWVSLYKFGNFLRRRHVAFPSKIKILVYVYVNACKAISKDTVSICLEQKTKNKKAVPCRWYCR
jgi:hypothetical protein